MSNSILPSIISAPSSSLSKSFPAPASASSSTQESQVHVDMYHEDECDVGPRCFHQAAIVPQNVMGLNDDVLHLIASYNEAVVYHGKKNYSLAAQLYRYISTTIGTFIPAGNSDATLSHLAMRAHNNMAQIEYKQRSEEYALIEFENALTYVRQAGEGRFHQQESIMLEIATVLSNWCRTRWMLGRVDDSVYSTLEEVLRIRSTYLEQNHQDVAAAHFNLGRAEFCRGGNSNQQALKHFLHYIRIASHLYDEKNNINGVNKTQLIGDISDFELDPIQGLIYVLQIQDGTKEDETSQDLIWGLRTLQENRRKFGSIHSNVASVLNNVGTILFRRREHDYALCFFAQELRIEERLRLQQQKQQPSVQNSSSSGDDVSISVTCNNIGRILQELGRFQEAKFYYQRSLGQDCDDDLTNDSAPACDCAINEVSKSKTFKTETRRKSKRPRNYNNNTERGTCDDNSDDDLNTSEIPPAVINLYSTVWYNLGLIHDKMGAFNEAIRAFRMSLKLRRGMLGNQHSDVMCLLYNIGVLQMEQNLLDDATTSFREALAQRNGSGKGQLNDRHVVKTLKKLSTMKNARGDLKGALESNRDILSVLTTSTDFKQVARNRNIAIVMREIADLNQAQGDLQAALENAVTSANLFRMARITELENKDMDVENDDDDEKATAPIIEEETYSLLLVGSLKHELCDPLNAQETFTETARTLHSTLSASVEFAPTLLPLLEVSAMLASGNCAAEA